MVAAMNNADTIAVVPKNKHEEIHIRLKRYNDLDLIDARVYADDGTQFLPTKKGICLHVNTLTLLIEGLQKVRPGVVVNPVEKTVDKVSGTILPGTSAK